MSGGLVAIMGAALVPVLVAGNAQAAQGWSPPVQLASYALSEGSNIAQTHVAMSTAGDRALAWWSEPANEATTLRWWNGTTWSAPTSFPSRDSRVAVDATGTHAVVVWPVWNGTNNVATASAWDGATWSAPVPVSAPGVESYPSGVTMSADGSTAMAWWYSPGGSQSARLHTGTWAAPVTVPAMITDVSLSANGSTGVAVYLDAVATVPSHPYVVATLWNGTGWDAPVTVSSTTEDAHAPVVRVSADGLSAVTAWSMYSDSYDPLVVDTIESARLTGSTWSSPAAVAPARDFSLAVSADTSVTRLAFADVNGISMASATGAVWAAPAPVPATAGPDVAAWFPSLAMSADGAHALLTWNDVFGTTSAADFGPGGWSAATAVGQPGDAYAAVALSADGAHGVAAWQSTCTGVCVAASVWSPSTPVVATAGAHITGVVRVGGVLRCAVTFTGATSVTYAWKRNGVTIPAATGVTYRLGAADFRRRASCVATGHGAGGAAVASTSAATALVAAGPALRALLAPTVTGVAKVGKTLRAAPGRWTPAATRYAYQWLRDGAVIRGAVAATYRVPASARGHRISVRVTAIRVAYLNGVKVSAAVRIR